MQKLGKIIEAVSFVCVTIVLGIVTNAHAFPFNSIPFTFETYQQSELDWSNSDDDSNTGSKPLGFSVTIGGATYSHFDMNSNGYVELLTGASDPPVNYGYDSITNLTSYEPTSTYLLAAYDDLSSYYYGYFGYKLIPGKAVFYYDTETFADEDSDWLNNFEMILYDTGSVQWNFNYADYHLYDYDLFSGLYFGNTGTLLELTSDYIPAEQSYEFNPVPEPATLLLLGAGVAGAGAWARRRTLTKGAAG